MMPILFQWGSLILPAWHTLYVLGAIVAYLLMIYLNRRKMLQLDERELANLYVACYIAGYFGARILSMEIEESGFSLRALFSLGPMTFYGGAVAAAVAGILMARWRRLPLGDAIDVTLPAGLLALAVGRLGCFLNGDDYGKIVTILGANAPWWSVVFPALGDGAARYPVQIFESVLVSMLVGILVASFHNLRTAFRPGAVGFFAVASYANIRFLLEFLRDDFRGFAFGTWLSTSQFISVCLLGVLALSAPAWLRQ